MPDEPEKKIASAPKTRFGLIKLIFIVAVASVALIGIWGITIINRSDPGCAIRISDTNSSVEDDDNPKQPSGSSYKCLGLERVSTPQELTRGLSGRQSLAQDRGMLFDFGKSGRHCIWMKDMKFAIDIIWLDQDQKVVTVRENVRPETYPETFCPDQLTKYVIEVNAGVARRIYPSRGSRLQF